jgi:uncharacterized protein YukE
MSGDNNKPNPHAAERQEANEQNGSIDGIAGITSAVNPFGSAPVRGVHFGKTSFEGYDLNEMIDIVESASPELLESAATALVDARDAIKEAADELKTNLGEVDWEGEAHSAFFKWGQSLVTTAHDLAGYADVVGTQILAAGSGLASVRKSMPPRDSRSDRKTVDDIPESKRVESNDEYAAALKAEKHRQEAINQMYRLASYYAVSQGTMSKAEEPVFPKMPDVGVPQPPPSFDPPKEPAPFEGPLSPRNHLGTASQYSAPSAAGPPHPVELPSAHKNVDGSATSPARHVGTQIDTVGTLPPQESVTKAPTGTPPTTTGPGSAPPGGTPVVAPGMIPPTLRGPAARPPGFAEAPGSRPQASAQGRAAGTPGGGQAGRTGAGSLGPVGRALTAGPPGGRVVGPVGRGINVGGSPGPGGLATGHSDGVPRAPIPGMGAMPPGRPGVGNTGTGRPSGGIVGGKPITAAAQGAAGSRMPRGTVIGETQPTSPTVGERPGRRAVVSASAPPTGGTAGQTPRLPLSGPDGVVGTPRGRTTEARPGGSFSAGAGVIGAPADNSGSSQRPSRRDERREGASATD